MLEDHRVKCWGNNGYGQLGYGDTLERGSAQEQMGDALPVVDLGSGRTAVKVVAGHYATCTILDDKSLKCWGMAGVNGRVPQQQLGDQPGEMGDNLAPLDFGGRRVSDAVIGHGVACALMENRTVWCWGPTAPKEVAGLSSVPVQALAAAGSSIFALYADGTVSPSLPNGTVPVFSAKVVTVSGAYGGPTCALLDDGGITCVSRPKIEPVGKTTAIAVAANSSTVCALSVDGSIRCPPTGEMCLPGQYWCEPAGTIALGQGATALTSGGDDFLCALLVDGGIKCWGGDFRLPPRSWLGAGVSLMSSADGVPNYSPWSSVDLGTRP
jgi:hypothetical protein